MARLAQRLQIGALGARLPRLNSLLTGVAKLRTSAHHRASSLSRPHAATPCEKLDRRHGLAISA